MANANELLDILMDASRPSVSFEFFPPKDQAGFDNLMSNFAKLEELNPDFASVTYGAMGSNQESSLAVVENLSKRLPTIAHLTCIGSTKSKIAELLGRYESAGVAAVLALRGDVPASFEGNPLGEFQNANELVSVIRESSSLAIGVSAFPEKHPESPSFSHDIEVLKLKQVNGASFAMTQMFFDIEAYTSLVANARAAGVTMPIVPGVMPIANAKQVLRMAEMSGAAIPTELMNDLNSAQDDAEAKAIGMAFSVELSKELLNRGAPGLHIFTLNQFTSANELITGIGLA